MRKSMFKTIVILILSLFLQACASSRIPQELQQGKMSFNKGNYQQAFRELLPLASEGNAEAEYAVGYMYYYGFGAPQDTETGMFWMQKSANQQHQPAISALKMLKANAQP
jgi:TPR repeat protein